MWLTKIHFGAWSQCWMMVGSHLLPIADVYSEHQGDGDHVCTRVFHSTPVVALQKNSRSGALPAWSLVCFGCGCWPVIRGSQEKRFRMIDFKFGASAMVTMSIQ